MAQEKAKITTEVVKIKITKDFKTLLKKDSVYEVSPSDAKHFVEVKKIAEYVK